MVNALDPASHIHPRRGPKQTLPGHVWGSMCSYSGFYLLGFVLFVCCYWWWWCVHTFQHVKMSDLRPHLPSCLRQWDARCFASTSSRLAGTQGSASSRLAGTQGSGASVHFPSSWRKAVITGITVCPSFTWTLPLRPSRLYVKCSHLLTHLCSLYVFFKEYAGCDPLSRQPFNISWKLLIIRELLAGLRKEMTYWKKSKHKELNPL